MRKLIALLIALLILALSLQADSFSVNGGSLGASKMFSKNSISLGVKLGSATIGNESYTIAGISGNYFVMKNLSFGLGYENWFSGDPSIKKLTVETTYYIPLHQKIRPYAGLLYRHIMISGSDVFGRNYEDTSAYGYRAGIAFVQDNILLSAGIVQERYDTTRFVDSTQTYGEVTIGFMF